MARGNKNEAPEVMAAETVKASATEAAGKALAAQATARETGALGIVKAIREARQAEGTDTSDRALSVAVHAEAIKARALALALPESAPAVTRGLGLGNVRAYVATEGMLSALGVAITKESARSAYLANVAGAKVAVVKAAKASDSWESATSAARAVALVGIVTEALKAERKAKAEAKAKAPKAEAEGETEGEGEAPQGMTEAEAEAYREGMILAGLGKALALVAGVKSAEGKGKAETMLAEALHTLTETYPEGYGPDMVRRVVKAEAERAEYKAEAETLARLLAEAAEAPALASV